MKIMTNEQKELVEANNWDIEAVEAFLELGEYDNGLEYFEESYSGKWNSDEEFVQDMLESVGTIPEDLPPYVHIDWEWTAKDIMMDYSEDNGHYFRDM